MKTLRTIILTLLAVLAAAVAGAAEPSLPDLEESDIARDVRKEILGLPYYGVFDLITFEVSDEGVVTLGGYVYEGSLKKSAERAVKKVKAVKEVENRIKLLPVSMHDDDVRWGVFWAIYRDSSLFRYGSAADFMIGGWRPGFRPWGWSYRRWDAFRRPRWAGAPFWGLEPIGSHAIHIIVRHGEVTLVGVVDTQVDKDLAGLKARGVFGVRKVENDLQVEDGSS